MTTKLKTTYMEQNLLRAMRNDASKKQDATAMRKSGQALSRTAPHLISKQQLLQNDRDWDSDTSQLPITAVLKAKGGTVSLSQSGDVLFQQFTFIDSERQLIKSVLPYMRDWYVQAGTSGLATTDDKNRGAFMLGGTGSAANDSVWRIAA